jgi:phosphatidylethanolamine/phosphatidyl-N-methylethanolamine N-methyltransferase
MALAVRLGAPLIFMREMMMHPATVGAIWPSSSQLARHMAAMVPPIADGLVVELGAGTGAITQALLKAGISEDRLLVIERSPVFVAVLQRRFPGVKVIEGDATRLAAILPTNLPVVAIVSGLPLRSLPSNEASAIVEQWRHVLAPGGRVIQFTYALLGCFEIRTEGFLQRASRIAWANLPPARVMALQTS